jgi:hypothetical protein
MQTAGTSKVGKGGLAAVSINEMEKSIVVYAVDSATAVPYFDRSTKAHETMGVIVHVCSGVDCQQLTGRRVWKQTVLNTSTAIGEELLVLVHDVGGERIEVNKDLRTDKTTSSRG